jgi:hypothetical protein
MYRPRTFITAAAVAAAALFAVPPGASAMPTPSDPIAEGLASPLQIDVGHKGQVYVGQTDPETFEGTLTKVRRNGSTKDLATQPGEIAGVASRGYTVAFLFTGGDESGPITALKKRLPNGKVRTIANLQRFEEQKNPDGGQMYGFQGLEPECADQVPAEVGGGYPYPGIVESHPYALANAPGGGWYVADAAMNAILKVSASGHVKVVKVLPPQPLTVTEEIAAGLGLPECVVGADYNFEPVPTDVEVAKNGKLVVSLLPGGPETPELGARGSVHKINPWTGAITTLGTGLVTSTNVALGPHGKIYVAELFANRISVLRGGAPVPFVELPLPASVEYANGKLYVSYDVFGNGSITTIRL